MTTQTTTVDYRVIEENGFIHRVYGWMGGGLLTTAIVSFYVATNQTILELIVGNSFIFFGLLLLEIGAVVYLSGFIHKMSATQAGVIFFLYSVLNGVTMSFIFLVYVASSIASVFVVSAGMFALVSAYGFLTKKDLTSWGNLLFMALIGLVLASVVNIFWVNDGFSLILAYAAVVIFVGLTAYDTQKIKELNDTLSIGGEDSKKASIIGALRLYLDFINLFLALLRIFGRRR